MQSLFSLAAMLWKNTSLQIVMASTFSMVVRPSQSAWLTSATKSTTACVRLSVLSAQGPPGCGAALVCGHSGA